MASSKSGGSSITMIKGLSTVCKVLVRGNRSPFIDQDTCQSDVGMTSESTKSDAGWGNLLPRAWIPPFHFGALNCLSCRYSKKGRAPSNVRRARILYNDIQSVTRVDSSGPFVPSRPRKPICGCTGRLPYFLPCCQ